MCEVDLVVKTYKDLDAKETDLIAELKRIADEKHELYLMIIREKPDWLKLFEE